MIQIIYSHQDFCILAMRTFIRFITVVALWIAVSATTHKYRAKKERTEKLPILKEEASEYESQRNLLENIYREFVEGHGEYKHHASERTGKFFSDIFKTIVQYIQIILNIYLSIIFLLMPKISILRLAQYQTISIPGVLERCHS